MTAVCVTCEKRQKRNVNHHLDLSIILSDDQREGQTFDQKSCYEGVRITATYTGPARM